MGKSITTTLHAHKDSIDTALAEAGRESDFEVRAGDTVDNHRSPCFLRRGGTLFQVGRFAREV
jgi:hypothetical protein